MFEQDFGFTLEELPTTPLYAGFVAPNRKLKPSAPVVLPSLYLASPKLMVRVPPPPVECSTDAFVWHVPQTFAAAPVPKVSVDGVSVTLNLALIWSMCFTCAPYPSFDFGLEPHEPATVS